MKIQFAFAASRLTCPKLGLGLFLAVFLPPAFYPASFCLLQGATDRTEQSLPAPHRFLMEWEKQKTTLPSTVRSELESFKTALQQFSQGRFEECDRLLQAGNMGASTEIEDYFLYYRGLSLKKKRQSAEAQKLFQSLSNRFSASPLAWRAAMELAQNDMDRSNYAQALSRLQDYDSREPSFLLLKAKSLIGKREWEQAASLLEDIYYRNPTAPEAADARSLLVGRKGKKSETGPPSPTLLWERIALLLEKGSTTKAYSESLRSPLPSSPAERYHALLVKGQAAMATLHTAEAIRWLQSIDSPQAEDYPQAQMLLSTLYRRREEGEALIRTSRGLRLRFPEHPATEQALFQLFLFHLDHERPDEAETVRRDLDALFPSGQSTQQALWMTAWNHYTKKEFPAAALAMERHLSTFPLSSYRRSALYWLGRTYLKSGRSEPAPKVFSALIEGQVRDYYGILAKKELEALSAAKVPETRLASPDPSLNFLKNPAGQDPRIALLAVQVSPFPAHWGRILQLEEAGAFKPALLEIEDRKKNGPPENAWYLIKARLHARLGQKWDAVRTIVQILPGYSTFPMEALPRDVWEILYPLEHWTAIQENSRKTRLEPFMVAALIRQESLFQQEAKSKANAMGLMQIRPATGKETAGKLGKSFSIPRLFQPDYNIELGTHYFAGLLQRANGRWDLALAAYNAGPTRVSTWLKEFPEESAEFVESIPFSETRSYVKNIFTHREHYRLLYQHKR